MSTITIRQQSMYVYWTKLMHLLSFSPSKLEGPLLYIYLLLQILNNHLDVHTTWKAIPFPYVYTLYSDASDNAPSYTHVSMHMTWRVHPLDLYSPSAKTPPMCQKMHAKTLDVTICWKIKIKSLSNDFIFGLKISLVRSTS